MCLFRYESAVDSWVLDTSRPTAYTYSAMVEYQPGILWIMGGGPSPSTSSSTIFSKPEGMRNGPTLPFAGDALCALAINQTHTFLVGGSSGGYRDEAYIYDLIRATWSEVSPPPWIRHADHTPADAGQLSILKQGQWRWW